MTKYSPIFSNILGANSSTDPGGSGSMNDMINTSDIQGAKLVDALNTINESSQLYKQGFNRLDASSMGSISFDDATRTFKIEAPFSYWAQGEKHNITTDKTIQIPAITGNYYFALKNDETLYYFNTEDFSLVEIYQNALCAGVYWSQENHVSELWEERHGYDMDSTTHLYAHMTVGCAYAAGLVPVDFAIGSDQYTRIDRGICFDEDIQHNIPSATSHRYAYRFGSAGNWAFSTHDNFTALKVPNDTYCSYNFYNGTEWTLKQGERDTDFWIMFIVFIPSVISNTESGEIVKLLGQNAYPNARTARNAIEAEMNKTIQDGLPSHEVKFIQAYIVKRNGQVQDSTGDGDIFYDLVGINGGNGNSATSVNSFCYPLIAVIDGETTTPLSGTVFDGYIDEKPNHIDSGDVLPVAFSNYTLVDYGTVSASSEYGAGYEVWRLLDKDTSTSWASNSTTVCNIKIVFNNPVNIKRFNLTSRSDTSNYDVMYPKDFSFKYSATTDTPDTTVKSWTNESSNGQGIANLYELNSTITAKSIIIDITDGNGSSSIGLSSFELFEYATTVVKAGTKYTTTKDAVSTLHEITTDTAIPIGADGDFTVYADKDGVVELGDEMALVKDNRINTWVYHTDYTSILGTVSASSEYSSSYRAWRGVDGVISGSSWISADNYVDGVGAEWLKYSFKYKSVISGLSIVLPPVAESDNIPKTVEVYGDGVLQQTFSIPMPTEDFHAETLTLTNSFIAKDVKIVTTELQTHNANPHVNYCDVEIYFNTPQTPYYDIATGNLYENDIVVEKCPLGQVTVSGGAITSVNPFYHGTNISFPVNNGTVIAKNTIIYDGIPFFAKDCINMVKIYDSSWKAVGGTMNGYGTESRIRDNNLFTRSLNNGFDRSGVYTGGEMSGDITADTNVIITIERGY